MSLFDGICRCPFWVSVLEQKSSNRWGRKEDLQLKKQHLRHSSLCCLDTNLASGKLWPWFNECRHLIKCSVLFFWPKAIMFEGTKHFKEVLPIFLHIFFYLIQQNPAESAWKNGCGIELVSNSENKFGAAGTAGILECLISTWKNTPEIWDTKNSHLSKESTFFLNASFFLPSSRSFSGDVCIFRFSSPMQHC